MRSFDMSAACVLNCVTRSCTSPSNFWSASWRFSYAYFSIFENYSLVSAAPLVKLIEASGKLAPLRFSKFFY